MAARTLSSLLTTLAIMLSFVASLTYRVRSPANLCTMTRTLTCHSRNSRISLYHIASKRADDSEYSSSSRGFSKSVSRNVGPISGSPSIDHNSQQQKLQELITAYQRTVGHSTLMSAAFSDTTASSSGTTGTTTATGDASTGAGTGKKVFDDTIKFPTEFMIKVVGTNEPTFVSDIIRTIGGCLDKQRMNSITYSTKETAGGKYVSVTVTPLFLTSQELYATYEAIAQDKRVKFTL